MKTFTGDFNKFLSFIKKNHNFTLVRYGDGEMMIMDGEGLNLLNKGAGEFEYDPKNEKYQKSRKLLTESFKHQSEDYFVGVACKCCVGEQKFLNMCTTSGQPEEQLTWANIFVNANYNRFVKEFIPALNSRRLALICHEVSDTSDLPFDVEEDLIFKVKTNAWVENLDLIETLKEKILDENLEDVVFIMCAGPFANILAYELNKFNPYNTYIDAGSTLDKYFKLPITRGYLNGAPTLKKVCIW